MEQQDFVKEALDYGHGNFYENGKLYLVRCPKCEKENYSIAVAQGGCAWCGWPQLEKGDQK